jgi:16S rRNA (cytosine967-C5)-methyltransferase
MTPAARIQSAIELLDAIITAARDGGAAADVVATRFFKERRYAGSKDRRAIRDWAWATIRRFGEVPPNGRAAMLALADGDAALAALFTGEPRAPAAIARGEVRAGGGVVPGWILPRLDPRVTGDELIALLDRAPLDLRVNRTMLGAVSLPEGSALPPPLDGLRLPHDTAILDHPAYVAGAIEVQDAGSQLIAQACAARPGMTVVDLCAGAGGKTLALAVAMQGTGRLIACDTDRRRLSQLGPRAQRAGAGAIETRLLDPGREAEQLSDLVGAADIVLIDAPCSGTGTWRRNPEARWRLTPARLERLMTTQRHILDFAAPLVTKGGAMVYAVCSVALGEGAEQVASFVARHAGWTSEPALPDAPGMGREAGHGLLLTPHHDATDGFFLARLRRN